MRTTWTFNTAGQIVFGRDSVRQLGDIAGQIGAFRAMIITDGILADAGLVERVSAPLLESGVQVEVFTGGRPDPPVHSVEDAVEIARDFQPQLLIGLGGGSNMDLTKAAATLLTHGGSCQDYAGDQLVPGPVHPLVLIPTTAGTGSEVTAASVLNDTDAGRKFALLSNYLRPRVALVDPLLMLSCPPSVTADSGIDALTHAIEAYTAIDYEQFPAPPEENTIYQGRHPLGDSLAEQAIGLVGQYLRRVVEDGSDVDAREGMALAALTAGMSFSNVGVALVHATEYALAPVAHTSHGRGCGMLLPHVMRYNAAARPAQMARIATLLGEEVAGLSDAEAADRAIAAVLQLNANIGIPARLSDVGVEASDVAGIAETTFGVKRILRVNPQEVTVEGITSMLESAM
ncbi:MAG: iron-containing alcohol dehydrogenase [Fuerstiella sp.]|nr:iron-containing alcohol dehydrogenase [Fuerstiella sp.]MCP4854440.1 iron-containing alcohol dehydrogenase [Fuerstiella sp.]